MCQIYDGPPSNAIADRKLLTMPTAVRNLTDDYYFAGMSHADYVHSQEFRLQEGGQGPKHREARRDVVKCRDRDTEGVKGSMGKGYPPPQHSTLCIIILHRNLTRAALRHIQTV